METLTATYRIVTPMFIGDGHQHATSIRPPSIKGALRFWWRALNWKRFIKDVDQATALRRLHEEEARLFGSAVREENGRQIGGQGKFLLSVDTTRLHTTNKNTVHPQFSKRDAARYLSYGLMEAFSSEKKGTQAGQLIRSCINENQEFTVHIRFRDTVESSLQDALILLGLLGGLGSRSRHGIGSIVLTHLYKIKENKREPCWTAPDSKESYQKMIQDILKDSLMVSQLPPYSAFSAQSRVDILLTQQTDPYSTLQNFAHSMLMYRSWGKDGKVLGQPSEKRFKSDHDWSKNIRPNNFHPRRVIFGLPHNYGKEKNQQVTSETYERRASPLFFHVHQIGAEQFLGVSILLKSIFLPSTERIRVGEKKSKEGDNLVSQNIKWSIITDFLDGLDGADGVPNHPPRFPNKEKII